MGQRMGFLPLYVVDTMQWIETSGGTGLKRHGTFLLTASLRLIVVTPGARLSLLTSVRRMTSL